MSLRPKNCHWKVLASDKDDGGEEEGEGIVTGATDLETQRGEDRCEPGNSGQGLEGDRKDLEGKGHG